MRNPKPGNGRSRSSVLGALIGRWPAHHRHGNRVAGVRSWYPRTTLSMASRLPLATIARLSSSSLGCRWSGSRILLPASVHSWIRRTQLGQLPTISPRNPLTPLPVLCSTDPARSSIVPCTSRLGRYAQLAKVHSLPRPPRVGRGCALVGLPLRGGAVVEVQADLNPRVDVYPVETLERLVTDFRRYHPIEADHATLDLDADPPTYAADFRDIKGYVSGQECQLGVPLS